MLLTISNILIAQNRMITHEGILNFEASVPLFEEVKALNKTATYDLNIKTGAISSLVLIKDFHFKMALMEAHFNEHYLESDHYPKAIFKGKILGFNWNIIDSSPKEFQMKGKLEIHGKKKEITTAVFLRKTDNGLGIFSTFSVLTSDFNIEIPTVLRMKVAEKATITTNFIVK